jgi:hypothetical protein
MDSFIYGNKGTKKQGHTKESNKVKYLRRGLKTDTLKKVATVQGKSEE